VRKASVLRRTLQHKPWQVSWLKATLACRPPSFPGHSTEWYVQVASLCLQWRDRAGISPDFPFKPNSGTVGYLICIT